MPKTRHERCVILARSLPSGYKWRSKYGGLEASELKRLKALEDENSRLKRMYSELSLDHQVLKDVIEKKL
ncbi:Mobile element protein [hydrothermal vent metagenome]|uniref:Mobile element protein n=1 Tax=hydrothermal vent metagenome TaxID=652676 RepID=A0A3B1CPL1_9ZZZZ